MGLRLSSPIGPSQCPGDSPRPRPRRLTHHQTVPGVASSIVGQGGQPSSHVLRRYCWLHFLLDVGLVVNPSIPLCSSSVAHLVGTTPLARWWHSRPWPGYLLRSVIK